MYKVNVELTGLAPIRFNRFTNEKPTGGTASHTDEAEKKDAINRCYWLDNEKQKGLYVPAEAVKRCLLNGINMAKIKEGKSSMINYVKATVFLDPLKIPLGKNSFDYMESITVRIPPGIKGSRVNKYFCYVKDGWKLPFVFNVVDDRRDSEKLKLALSEAGLLCGLLDGRPDYGRFEVTGWGVIKGK